MAYAGQKFETRQFMHREDFEVFHYRDLKPGCVEVHHHDFYEVYCFLGGDVEYRVEGKSYRLQPGDLLFMSPMELHRPLVISDSAPYERIVLWINQEYLAAQDESLRQCFNTELPTRDNLIRPNPYERKQIQEHMSQLAQERNSQEFGSEIFARGVFLQLMVLLNRLALQSISDSQETQSLPARVVSYIGRHYAQQISLDSLAQHFFVSKYHLSHIFTKATGVSVYRYIILKRLQVARQALMDGATPKNAFSSSGFGDYANFYRAFQHEYGQTPHEFSNDIHRN